jgi:rod shape-determining protein MreC
VGTGDSDRLSLPFVTVESDLKAGDLLISTGMGGVFPSGYPVAEVMRVERDPAATFAVVDARPTARLDRDREVLLVWFDPPVVDTTPPEATAPEVSDPEAPGTATTTPAPPAPPAAAPASTAAASTAPAFTTTDTAATTDTSAPPPEPAQ